MKPVTVTCGGETAEFQPDGFRCCPLGVQFYTDREMAPYRIMEMELQFSRNGDGPMNARCTGVVVQSAFDKRTSKYRTWLLFTDLNKDTRSRLQCVSKSAGTQCEHCLNY